MNNREAFEAWANTHGGLDLTTNNAMDNEKLPFPCTYYNYTTEIAWRAFANKKVPAQQKCSCVRAAYEAQRNEVERLQKENAELKESNLELERLCDRTYVQQGADAYNHCCEVFEAWRVKRQKLDLPTHDWADGLYNSLNWLQDTVEELETEYAAQEKRVEETMSLLNRRRDHFKKLFDENRLCMSAHDKYWAASDTLAQVD